MIEKHPDGLVADRAAYTRAKMSIDADALVLSSNGETVRYRLTTCRFGVRDELGFADLTTRKGSDTGRYDWRMITVDGVAVGRLRFDDPTISHLLAAEILRDTQRVALDKQSPVARARKQGDRAGLAEAIHTARKGARGRSALYDMPLLPLCDELASHGTRPDSVASFVAFVATTQNSHGLREVLEAVPGLLARGVPGAATMVTEFRGAAARREPDIYLTSTITALDAAEQKAAGSTSGTGANTAENFAIGGLAVWLIAVWLDHSSWLPRWAGRGGDHGVNVDTASREQLWKLSPDLHSLVRTASWLGRAVFAVAFAVYLFDSLESAWTSWRARRHRHRATGG